MCQTTLRSVLNKHDLDDILSKRDELNHDIQSMLDDSTEGWGIKVTNVELSVDIDPTMMRAIAKQAEAGGMASKIINAEGEFQAAKQLDAAAEIVAAAQALCNALSITLQDIAGDKPIQSRCHHFQI